MFKKQKTIDISNNLNGCHFENNKIFFVIENYNLMRYNIDNLSKTSLYAFNEGFPNIRQIDSKFIWISFKSNLFRICKEIQIDDLFDFGDFCSIEKEYAIFHNNRNEINYFSYVDLGENKLIWEQPNLIAPEIIGGHIISGDFDRDIIVLHSKKTGNILWQKNLSQEFEGLKIGNFIGVYKDILLVGLGTTSDVNNYLVALNIHNGEVLWYLKAFHQGFLIDKERDVMYSILINYVKIDIKTGEVLDNYVNRSYFEQIRIESRRLNFVQVDDYLITTDDKKGKIGAFNTITHQFDWIHEEPKTWFPGGRPMVYKAPYLFVQDSENTVHIFERMQ